VSSRTRPNASTCANKVGLGLSLRQAAYGDLPILDIGARKVKEVEDGDAPCEYWLIGRIILYFGRMWEEMEVPLVGWFGRPTNRSDPSLIAISATQSISTLLFF
jgi:hypothetical protein